MTELTDQTTRRAVLGGVAAVGAGAVLAACGSDEPTGTTGGGDTTSDSGSGGDSSASGEIGTTADVPVGGGTVFQKEKIVVTQPTEGDFKAFTAVCTHQGCLVESSSEGDIPCPCHLSRFSLEDGSPLSGPAGSPLESVGITVDGDSIALA